MGALLAKENIWYVGTQDPNLRVFDIIMHSDWGTSYNAYLVKGSEKTALFETSKLEFFDEFLANVREVCDPASIDYIVVDHTEPDHTGSMEKLLELAPNATVLGSATALNFLKQIVNHDFTCRAVTEKDTVDLGGMTLHFLSVPFLHWPDSMYTYIPEAKALFTCDSFGCHYADSRVFNDLIEGDFTQAYKYYFDCIIGPFKRPYMVNALEKIKGLDIEFVGNGHGPVLRSDVQKYLDMYAAAAAAVEDADGFLLGSPTLVGDALPPVYEMLLGLNPIIHKGKFAGAFGSYGWSGEAVPNLVARMQQLKLSLPAEGLRVRFKPTEQDLTAAKEYGAAFARAVKGES